MSTAKPKPSAVAVTAVGKTVWSKMATTERTTAPTKTAAAAESGAAAKKAQPPRKRAGPITVTILETPLRPLHSSRKALAKAARSVK